MKISVLPTPFRVPFPTGSLVSINLTWKLKIGAATVTVGNMQACMTAVQEIYGTGTISGLQITSKYTMRAGALAAHCPPRFFPRDWRRVGTLLSVSDIRAGKRLRKNLRKGPFAVVCSTVTSRSLITTRGEEYIC